LHESDSKPYRLGTTINKGLDEMIKQEYIRVGYKAFNGHIFTEKECEIYNNAIFYTKDEIHRFFCLIIGIYNN